MAGWRETPGRRRDRGQSVVELALIAPILIMVFLGIVDFSRVYHAASAASNAARVGAEVAMNSQNTDQQITSAVQREVSPTIAFNSISITPTQSLRSSGDSVQIGVTYVFSPYTPLVANFWGGGTLPLVVTATARVY